MYVVRKSQAERRATADRKLLTAAYRIISESGISALTCEDVGKRAGYSRGQTYQRFGSKEGLLVAAVRHVSAERARFARSLRRRGANGVDRLVSHCRLHLDALAHHVKMRAFFRFASGPLPSMPDLETAVLTARQVYLDEITALLSQASADGSLRSGTDIKSAAATISNASLVEDCAPSRVHMTARWSFCAAHIHQRRRAAEWVMMAFQVSMCRYDLCVRGCLRKPSQVHAWY